MYHPVVAICDRIYKNHPYSHILYFEKYYFELLKQLWFSCATLYPCQICYIILIASVSKLTLLHSIYCWFFKQFFITPVISQMSCIRGEQVGGGQRVVGVMGKMKPGSPYHQGTDSGAVFSFDDRDVHNPQDGSKHILAAVWHPTNSD